MTTAIVAQDELAVVTADEVAALALEIFIHSYGMDWDTAVSEAFETVVDLATYGAEWDVDALIAGNLEAL